MDMQSGSICRANRRSSGLVTNTPYSPRAASEISCADLAEYIVGNPPEHPSEAARLLVRALARRTARLHFGVRRGYTTLPIALALQLVALIILAIMASNFGRP